MFVLPKAMKSSICLVVTALFIMIEAGVGADETGKAEMICLFEDANGSSETHNSGGIGGSIVLSGESRVTHESAKFGEGSMRIGANRYQPIMATIPLEKGGFADMGTDLRRLSLVCWVKPADISHSFGIAERRPPAEYGGFWGLGFTGYNTLLFRITGENAENEECHSKSIQHLIAADEWIHLAVTYDEGEVIFYVNGEKWGGSHHFNQTQIPASDINRTTLSLFRENVEGTLVDDFAIFYDRLLAEDEIADICQKGLEAFLKNQKP